MHFLIFVSLIEAQMCNSVSFYHHFNVQELKVSHVREDDALDACKAAKLNSFFSLLCLSGDTYCSGCWSVECSKHPNLSFGVTGDKEVMMSFRSNWTWSLHFLVVRFPGFHPGFDSTYSNLHIRTDISGRGSKEQLYLIMALLHLPPDEWWCCHC